MYEKNLELLTPWLKESVKAIDEEELWEKIEVTYNAEGYPVCRYHQDGLCFHITSKHPVQEAEIWAKTIQQQGSTEVFLYGTGFGYALFQLFEQKMPHTLVIVFEQNIYLFKAMLYYFDLSPIIQTQKISFFVGDSPQFKKAFEKLFYSLIFFSTTYPTVAFTLPAVRNFKKEYLEIHRYIFRELSLLTSYIGNDHQDNMIGLRNLMRNTKEVLKNPYLSCLKDQYRNVPAFIISNGPSLDLSLSQLKKIQGRGLIICVESAIVPLTKNGINPDVLAVVERTKYTYLYHFEHRNYSPDIALLSLALVDPRVYPSFGGEIIPIFRKGEELNRWFNQSLGDMSALNAGSNVSHLALDVATYLGADPIIFVGQDFAYGPEGVTHSKDAVSSQEKGKRARDILHSIPTVYVEGNNGEMIPSNQLWLNFRLGLEHIIAEQPENHFYNATEGGAKIRGTERGKLSDLIEQYCTQPLPVRVNELIAEKKADLSIADRRTRLEKFLEEVQRYAALFRSLASEMNLRRLESETMLRLCAAADHEKHSAILDETYQRNIAAFYQYAKDNLCRSFFQQLICAYFYLMNRLGNIDTQEKRVQIFNIQGQLYHDLSVVSQSLSVSLEEAEEDLNAFLHEFHEKEA
ncbi:motility associated factor glycosyltransferase family protein [Faecalispora anaeroviscerum]|uniref:motility associated factor glycosyltransferase family protein n=1 Tax=Faecalispora anaeroviscerum TaxID=2991836 RepID=UPI0024BA52DE|nr:6-hydroxymethylpterin diphosphokinase MptE-like protein [Faecalispora anaeroviscerum]